MPREFTVMGQSHIRKDAREKVTGTAKYMPDMKFPQMLYAKFLRSPHAHARIVSIDVTEAENLTGVAAVLTHKDVPKHHPHRRFTYILDETVHYPGEEVAAVAAISPEIAEKALELIKVEYEILPAVFEPEEALKEGAPLARPEMGSNIVKGKEFIHFGRWGEDGSLKLDYGDVDQGFAEADVIVEGEYKSPMQYNCSPAPRTVICQWAGDKLTCWGDTQLPLNLWRDLSQSLKIPMSDVRLISNNSIGGYGAKSPEKIATLCAIMAKKTDKPVKAAYSRSEDFISTHHRLDYATSHKVGVKKDGKVTALQSKVIAHWGNDSASPGIAQAAALLSACSSLYPVEATRAESYGVLTNTLGYGPMNGFGTPEAIYPIERLMDEAAEAIDMDPVEFRVINCTRGGDRTMELEKVLNGPIEWGIMGSDFDVFSDLIRKTAEKARWKETWKGFKTPVAVDGYKRRGIGMAIGIHHTSVWPASAIVKMNQDGTANVLSGAVEIGQGFGTAITQVVAEALGIRYQDVNPVLCDTAVTPAAIGNVASSGTTSPINAARIAAEDARRKILEIASVRLDAPIEDLDILDRKVVVKGEDRFLSVPEICMTNWQITGVGNNPPAHSYIDPETGKVIYSYATVVSFAEVDVDMETGAVKLLRVVSGHDTGRSINPVIIENQIDLGLIMAGGWVLSEEFLIDRQRGTVANPNLVDYKVQTFMDIPTRADLGKVVMEKECVWGPYGAKGFSESAMTALAPAIANAIYNAAGVRIREGSLVARNVLSAIEEMEGK